MAAAGRRRPPAAVSAERLDPSCSPVQNLEPVSEHTWSDRVVTRSSESQLAFAVDCHPTPSVLSRAKCRVCAPERLLAKAAGCSRSEQRRKLRCAKLHSRRCGRPHTKRRQRRPGAAPARPSGALLRHHDRVAPPRVGPATARRRALSWRRSKAQTRHFARDRTLGCAASFRHRRWRAQLRNHVQAIICISCLRVCQALFTDEVTPDPVHQPRFSKQSAECQHAIQKSLKTRGSAGFATKGSSESSCTINLLKLRDNFLKLL